MKSTILIMLVFLSLIRADEYKEIVQEHRKMLVMLDGLEQETTEEAIFAARSFYILKNEAIENILEKSHIQASSFAKDKPLYSSESFIAFYKKADDLYEADKLAFISFADELLEIEKSREASSSIVEDLEEINTDINSALEFYAKEYQKSMSKLTTRGSHEREAWAEYISYIKSIYKYETLLESVYKGNASLYNGQSRGKESQKDKKDTLIEQKTKVVWGNGLPDKTVVLSFDDGPHYTRTEKILDILKEYEVKGYFFSVGKNLGVVDKKGEAQLSKREAVAKRLVAEGHLLANHSYSHPVLPKLDVKEQLDELSTTNMLIKAVSGKDNTLFRPPYGARSKQFDALASKEDQIFVMWNVDSMDWADPLPTSIADRVLREVERRQKGLLLFHDIHKQTIAALPDILSGLSERGYKVVRLDGTDFDLNTTGIPKIQAKEEKPIYSKSWAVVIGVNDYKHWPKLKYAVNDAKSIANALETKMGFAKENIIELYDENATRDRISEVLGYDMADTKRVKKDDRVFVFYAGHGMTRALPTGKDLGYIIPYDAQLSNFQTRSISMTELLDYSSAIPAKHLYFVMDSCYSGLALTRAGVSVGQTLNYVNQITSRRARQILTAGGANEEVADGGPDGHSIFTWTLLQGFEGLADTDNNGYITASELATYVTPVVASYSEQTPTFGNLVGSKGGDFVFKIDNEALLKINEKIADETAQIEKELEALRTNTKAMVKRRLELAITLAKEKNGERATKEEVNESDKEKGDRIKQARRLNASALQFFKEKKYNKAKIEWKEAVRLNPYNPTIVNNYGFVLDKLNENEEALKFYYRTVELDPQRISIYLNLGDMMVKLKRDSQAIPYYERYLHLYPSYKESKQLRKKIKQLKTAS